MTIEELEAKLETVSRERDDAHARWVAIINNRGTTISDVETLTNDLNVALSQRDKVRVELRDARILTQEIGDVCRGKREPSKGAAIILGPLLRERDEAKKEAAESSKEMIMLYNDHSSVELEKQLRIEELTRERDKFQALAELSDGYRRERDVANDSALMFERDWKDACRERDEARAALADATTEWKARRCECGADDFCKIAQERNEARAEVERFRDWYRNAFGGQSKRETPWAPCACDECESLRRLKDEQPVHPSNLTDVVSLLEDERDELLVRVADQGAELRATRESYNEARSLLLQARNAVEHERDRLSDCEHDPAFCTCDEAAKASALLATIDALNADPGELRRRRTLERDEARAEVQRLADERDELLKAYAKAHDEWDHSKYSRAEVAVAYRRGAEAMREACADCVKHLSHEDGLGMGSQRLEGAIRALPIPEQP